MAHRKDVSTLGNADLKKLRKLLDKYISKPKNNPVKEHMKAGMDSSLKIHTTGFLAWHQHFVAELEHWLVLSGGGKFVPCPVWNPADHIPDQLSKGNTDVNMPLPASLQPPGLLALPSYQAMNNAILPYHNNVHDAAGGLMPDPHKSPGDPIFWPFHAFLLSVYETWRGS